MVEDSIFSDVKIKVGKTSKDCAVEVDGKEVKGLMNLKYELSPNTITTIKIEKLCNILIDGKCKVDERAVCPFKESMHELKDAIDEKRLIATGTFNIYITQTFSEKVTREEIEEAGKTTMKAVEDAIKPLVDTTNGL